MSANKADPKSCQAPIWPSLQVWDNNERLCGLHNLQLHPFLLHCTGLCTGQPHCKTSNFLSKNKSHNSIPAHQCNSVKQGFMYNVRIVHIHPKRWILWIPESADNLEFSAERLSENTKTISLSSQEQKILNLSQIKVKRC